MSRNKKHRAWILPEGIEDLLPAQAEQVENLRRGFLDLLHSWGYQLVIPPLVEYLESLTVGAGNDLYRNTFKFMDTHNGRMLGIRADMTPQVARIDARRMQADHPARLCYLGPVLLTEARELGGSRNPVQAGAELYGHSGVESDLEVLELMVLTVQLCGLKDISLDLGHVGLFRALAQGFGLSDEEERQLAHIFKRKAQPELEEFLAELANPGAEVFRHLITLHGGPEILAQAEQMLTECGEEVRAALQRVRRAVEHLQHYYPTLDIHVDLAELRGYKYHTGLVFAVYKQESWQPLAQGGRYDAIGSQFGRSRPATGFTVDLTTITQLTGLQDSEAQAILAPADPDPALRDTIQMLRSQGERVVQLLPGQSGEDVAALCNRQLKKQGQSWQLATL